MSCRANVEGRPSVDYLNAYKGSQILQRSKRMGL